MKIPNAYHEGELRIQQLDGVLQQAQSSGRVIAETIIKGALKFIAQQPMAVLGSVDDDQSVWASILFGRPGFMTAPDEKTVEFDLSQAGINPDDPFWTNVQQNPPRMPCGWGSAALPPEPTASPKQRSARVDGKAL